MEKHWTDLIPESYIAALCAEYARLFDRVRKHAGSELHASLMVLELIRRFPPMPKGKAKFGPAYEVQIKELEGYGIKKLSDLNWKQAFDLIDSELDKRREYPY